MKINKLFKFYVICNCLIIGIFPLIVTGQTQRLEEKHLVPRYIYQDNMQDINGNILSGATVAIYLAGTSTTANVHGDVNGGSAVNSAKTYKYLLDATATDQGAATTKGDRSLKDLIDRIGTSKFATIILPHLGTGNTTIYTLRTSETIPRNITLRKAPGAIIDGVGTLTINGPFECGLDQAFGSSITVSFGSGAVKEVYPEWWGSNSTPGTTDMATEIQAADTAAATIGIGKVVFASQDYLIGSKITKDPYTLWEGTLGSQSPQDGTNLVLGYNGVMIQISDSGTQYVGNVGIRKMRLLGDLSSYAAGVGVDITTTVRRQVFEDLYVYGFQSGFRGIIHESYYNRCFFSGNVYGLNTTGGGADTFINNSHFGSGLGATGVNNANGLRLNNANNFRISNSRFQVNEEGSGTATGHGARIKNSTNIYFDNCYFDLNEGYGLYVIDSQDVVVTNPSAYDNGSAKANRAGIALFATNINDNADTLDFTYDGSGDTFTITSANHEIANTRIAVQVTTTDTLPTGLSASTNYYFIKVDADQFKLASTQQNAIDGTAVSISGAGAGTHTLLGVIENIQINGGRFYDRGNGYQTNGVKFKRSVSANEINNLTIIGADFSGVASPLADWSYVTSSLRITDCAGLSVEEITADGATLQTWGASQLNSTSNKVDSTLGSGAFVGQIKTIVMTEASNSSTVTITYHQTSDPEVVTFDAVDETGVFMWTGTEWVTLFATCTFL